MKCPSCKGVKSQVLNTTSYFQETVKIRVRQCCNCYHTWRTKEEIFSENLKTYTAQERSPVQEKTAQE